MCNEWRGKYKWKPEDIIAMRAMKKQGDNWLSDLLIGAGKFLLDDFIKCADGSLSACGIMLVSFVPGGKVLGAVAKYAPRVAGKLGKAAADCFKNSFTGETLVLMADGSSKAISDVQSGDEVLATDPTTEETAAKKVTALIKSSGMKNLVEIGIRTKHSGEADFQSITATDMHPFWVANLDQWVPATNLRAGMMLRTSAGTLIQVEAIERWSAERRVHNFTVADLHAYYVLAGSMPVLVHNAKPCLLPPYMASDRWQHIKDRHFPGGKDVTRDSGLFSGTDKQVKARLYDVIYGGRVMTNTNGRPGFTYTLGFKKPVGYKLNRSGERTNLYSSQSS